MAEPLSRRDDLNFFFHRPEIFNDYQNNNIFTLSFTMSPHQLHINSPSQQSDSYEMVVGSMDCSKMIVCRSLINEKIHTTSIFLTSIDCFGWFLWMNADFVIVDVVVGTMILGIQTTQLLPRWVQHLLLLLLLL